MYMTYSSMFPDSYGLFIAEIILQIILSYEIPEVPSIDRCLLINNGNYKKNYWIEFRGRYHSH